RFSTGGELVLQNYIGGKFVPCSKHLDSYDPSVGQVYCRVPDSGAQEVEAAVKAAKEAFPGWSEKSPADRAKVMNKLADLMEARLEEFAQAESKDQGKTVTAARTLDIPRAVQNFRYFASSIQHHTTECSQLDHMGCISYTIRCPVGVAGLISPWNLPLYLLTWKIAPAVAMGNTVVAKPSEMTSVTAWMMCQLLEEAGEEECVCFVGTDHRLWIAGQSILCVQCCAAWGCLCSTVFFYLFTLFFLSVYQGEICLCTSRIFVERSIYPQFLAKFVEAARQWKTGAPSDPYSINGALVSKEHLEKVRSYVALARAEGAQIHCGEGVDALNLPPQNAGGYFMLPTVITGVKDSSRVMQEEIFGPVTCITPFDQEEEVIARANAVRYGLSAVVWSKDVGRVHRVARRLEAGLVWTNCWLIRDLNLPFGGMKCSGVGREGGKDSYHFFTEVKTITVKQ
uniref:Aldehyde dehydrogenase 8 family, member A1 n=1 Tax=Astyanax mexicanus TaxID=7994 RepID=A0A8B9L0T8_ASTMX